MPSLSTLMALNGQDDTRPDHRIFHVKIAELGIDGAKDE